MFAGSLEDEGVGLNDRARLTSLTKDEELHDTEVVLLQAVHDSIKLKIISSVLNVGDATHQQAKNLIGASMRSPLHDFECLSFPMIWTKVKVSGAKAVMYFVGISKILQRLKKYQLGDVPREEAA